MASDDETTIDRIDFNDPTNNNLKDAKLENAWLVDFERISGQGIGDDQPAEEETGSLDVTGNVEDQYTITAKITNTKGNSDNGQNQFLILLDLWDAENKKNSVVEWPEGRFGVIDDTDHTNDLVPIRTGTSQIGLIWESYRKKTNLAKNQTDIVIKLRVSKGDGT